MTSQPQLFVEAYQQLASISAVLGGLAFTAAAALLATAVATTDAAFVKSAKVTVAMAVASAVSLVLAALMWSLMAADLSRAVARQEFRSHGVFSSFNLYPSVALIVGVLFFFASVGSSGWIASRRLGWWTSAMALFGGCAAVWVLWTFSAWR